MVKHLKSEFYIPFLFFQNSVNEIPLLPGWRDKSTVTPIGVYVCVCVCVWVCVLFGQFGLNSSHHAVCQEC